jgi:hypothetical protein
MKTRTAPALAAVLLATVTTIGLASGGDAIASDIRGRAIEVQIENSIDTDIAINGRAIGYDDSTGDISSDINVTADDLAEINLNINEEEIAQGITNINDINDIYIAGRIGRIQGLDDMGLIGIAEISLIRDADASRIGANI